MADDITRLTLMESKILGLGKIQFEKGYSGGAITPGLVRKETEYSYRAINMAMETLIGQELMEKIPRSSFRNGSVVELDVYRITVKGLEVLEKVQAGAIRVTGSDEPAPRPFRPSPQPSRHWDRPPDRNEQYRAPPNELADIVRNLQAAMKTLSDDVRSLHDKIDHMMNQSPAPVAARGTAKAPKKTDHTFLVLKAVSALAAVRGNVLAEEVREVYFTECGRLGLKPKGQTQFTSYLKRLQEKGLLELKRTGCRNLGIKGHGSRVCVLMSAGGKEYIARQG
jgi:hypothetical protein